MLQWKLPHRDLRRLGIRQEGVIQKVVLAIKEEQESTYFLPSVTSTPVPSFCTQ